MSVPATTWYHLPPDLHHKILTNLPLPDALSLSEASPSPDTRSHIRYRIATLKPLRDAWVHSKGVSLRTYANPPHLRTNAERAALPPSAFAALHVLPVPFSALTHLTGVSELHQLRVLDASGNNLTDIPFELSTCKKLRVLNLGQNSLTAFPDVVLSLPELRTLLLHQNWIRRLPEDWSVVTHLYRLGLYDCGIRAPLPRMLCGMLGTITDGCRRRSANLQRNLIDCQGFQILFREFPLMASAVVI